MAENTPTFAVVAPHADLFWSKVERGTPDECWLWQRGITGSGYGQFALTPARTGWDRCVTVRAHRVAWMLANRRDLPSRADGWVLDHRCNERRCCNPSHLEVTTFARNLQAGHPKGRTPELLPSGRYKVRYREVRDGRGVQTSRTFATEAEAQAFSRDLKAAAGAPERIVK